MAHRLSVEELARQADVDAGFVQRLRQLGALTAGDDPLPFGEADVRRVRLLHAWDRAGMSVEAVMQVVRAGELSFGFITTPSMGLPERSPRTYREVAADLGLPLPTVQRLHEAIGFARPGPEDRVREDELPLLELLQGLLSAGVSEAAALGVFRVHAEGVRRAAKAEADMYEREVEERGRMSGMSEKDLLSLGADVADRIQPLLEQSLMALYQRHRSHVWIEHSVGHAEAALEAAGLAERAPSRHAICFVDLAGYTRLTEELGDRTAARLAAGLASLIDGISSRHRGRAIRWLGDGGLFHFKDVDAAVLAGLEMVESEAEDRLPPRHVGIHSGPVIFQDGDVYGRTVNLAARISSVAPAGHVLVSEETTELVTQANVGFEPVGPIPLKGVRDPVNLYRAVRRSS